MKKILLMAAAVGAAVAPARALTASFASQEAETAVFACGFDSDEEMEGWTVAGWQLEAVPRLDQGDVKPFSTINPESVYSAACLDQLKPQNEAMVSPEVEVPEGARLRFYAAFSEYFGLWGHMEVSVLDGTESTLLLNSFLWSQEDGNEGSRWVPFSYYLSAFAGRKVRFEFRYINTDNGGDNVYVDDVAVSVTDASPESSITIFEEGSVHFTDLSEGATAWEWTFAGGTPSASTEQNPVVTYAEPGVYDVTLTVSDESGATATATRKAYVNVKGQTPTARVGLPAGCYMSPWTMCYVPVGTPVTFSDRSTGKPTEWIWQLPGTDKPVCYDQNPTVTYTQEGVFGLSLRAGNASGSTVDEYRDAVRAGGAEYVWNISPEESAAIEPIDMSWYGNYAGTNFLGLGAFAERFEAPAAAGSIDCVQAYFGKVYHVAASADAPIVVSVCEEAAEGGPGAVLATTSLPAKELVDGYQAYDPTTFTFDEPALVKKGKPFYVVIGPFPANEDESYNVDDIALYCSPRRDADKGGYSTAWHFAYDENPDNPYEYLTTGKWMAQTDELVSLALTPHLEFDKAQVGIDDAVADTAIEVRREGDMLFAAGDVLVYNLAGMLVARGTDSVHVGSLASGVYVVRTPAGAAKVVL